MSDRKEPTEEDKEECLKEAVSLVGDLMPGDWGQISSKNKGKDSALAVHSYPHHKRTPFLIMAHACYWEFPGRGSEPREDFLNGFKLEDDQIEWLYRQLGHHLAHKKFMQEEINYKKGDIVRLKSEANISYVKQGELFKATYMSLDHNSDTVGISKINSKNLWCFAPARLFEKV